jgi:hypothetical protein
METLIWNLPGHITSCWRYFDYAQHGGTPTTTSFAFCIQLVVGDTSTTLSTAELQQQQFILSEMHFHRIHNFLQRLFNDFLIRMPQNNKSFSLVAR